MRNMTTKIKADRIKEFKYNNKRYNKSLVVSAYLSLDEGYLFLVDNSKFAIELDKLQRSYNDWGNEHLKVNLNIDYLCSVTNGQVVENRLEYSSLPDLPDLSIYLINEDIIQMFRQIMLPKKIDDVFYCLPTNVSKYKLFENRLVLMNPYIEVYLKTQPVTYLSYTDGEQKKILNIFPELYSNQEIIGFINSEDNEYDYDIDESYITTPVIAKTDMIKSMFLNV